MWYRSNRKGYLCGSYSKHGRIACSHHFVREVHLEEVILTRLNKAAERLKNVDHNSERSVLTTETLKQLHKSIKEVEQSLLEITTKKRKYLTLLSEDVLTHPEYREAMDSLHEATLHLNIKRSELNRSLQLIKSNVNSHVHAFLEQAPFKKVTKKQLATFVKRIEVNETGEFIT
ncbi:MAG: zinc ribbon domain-containing protein [Candidatus Pristimantibacillus lignocellulolyticus]|uniref:Zinc ribbon domain-containing protein n=1 Tax=Candidatus Pristimantibacillus lignocellulolyticus TaxID=2994561 RepID=A0A9J6ZL92_9BACL|nr:MAG: zinc ribbon domain-containing protein [Candidatus Pristimantibacillus lignocellulolyticus]